ncbi:MAG TPA: FMN-binding negative transcriptional regulator [Burkholderiales bacterium]|nr:FMN-binding negative transcriptional regulator [Burkholderiales bacterium]
MDVIHIPKHFAEDDLTRLQSLVHAHNFATLVSAHEGKIQVSHLPFLMDDAGKMLRAHMARANPQWQTFSPEREVVVIFHGPHHYVSPAWYASHPSVPTWNYAVVHAQGRPTLINDRKWLATLVRDLVTRHEAASPEPWKMDLPADYQDKMLSGIVGFQIEITRLEGKFKLSQNRPGADRPMVIEELERLGSDDALGVAALMRDDLAKH